VSYRSSLAFLSNLTRAGSTNAEEIVLTAEQANRVKSGMQEKATLACVCTLASQ